MDIGAGKGTDGVPVLLEAAGMGMGFGGGAGAVRGRSVRSWCALTTADADADADALGEPLRRMRAGDLAGRTPA